MSTLTSKLIMSLVDRVTRPARGVEGAMNRLKRAAAQNQRQMNAMQTRMMASVGAGYALARAIGSPVKAAMAFESVMADVRKVVDFPTPKAFQQMGKDIIAMSKRIPMAATGLGDIVAAAGQAGMKGGELLAFAEMAAKVGVAFDMSAGVTGRSLARIKTALGLSVAQTGALADAINHLSNTSASSAPDIIDYMKRVGAEGTKYGFTAAQTAAIGSAMIAAGAEANVAATSFRNVGRALARGASATKRQRKAFKRLGLDSKAVAKNLQKNAVGTLNDVLSRIRALPKHIQASTISDLFGDEARAIAPLIQNTKLLGESLNAVAQKTNYLGSAQKEYAVRAQTTANKMQLFKNQISATGIAIGSALLPAVTDLMGLFGPVVNHITEWTEQNPELTKTIVAVTAGLIGLNIALTATRFAFLWMKGGVLSAAIVGLKGVGAAALVAAGAFKKLRVAIVGATMLAAVGGGGGFLAGMAASIVGAVTAIGAAVAAITAPVLAAAAAIIAAIAGVGLAFNCYWEPISNFVSGFISGIMVELNRLVAFLKQFATNRLLDLGELLGIDRTAMQAGLNAAIQDVKNFTNQVVGWIKAIPGRVAGWFKGVFSTKDFSDEAEKEFRNAGTNAARAFVDALKGIVKNTAMILREIVDLFMSLPERIMSVVGSINLRDIIKWPSMPSWLSGGKSPSAPKAPAIDGARAAGGAVAGGKTYLVGEKGPELFNAPRNGEIIPNGGDAPKVAARTASFSIGDIHIHNPASIDDIVDQIGERLRDELSGIAADTEYSVA